MFVVFKYMVIKVSDDGHDNQDRFSTVSKNKFTVYIYIYIYEH